MSETATKQPRFDSVRLGHDGGERKKETGHEQRPRQQIIDRGQIGTMAVPGPQARESSGVRGQIA